MTRINAGIPPKELVDKHLLAEHREIKRIPNAIANGRFNMKGQPEEFTLGTGHVKFFYDKCLYLLKRYLAIRDECIKRGFNVTDYADAWNKVPGKYMGDYTPTDRDRRIVEERINEKLNKNETI